MCGTNIFKSLTCANCGAAAQVVISLGDQGGLNVTSQVGGKRYVAVECPYCGKVLREIGDGTRKSVPHNRV